MQPGSLSTPGQAQFNLKSRQMQRVLHFVITAASSFQCAAIRSRNLVCDRGLPRPNSRDGNLASLLFAHPKELKYSLKLRGGQPPYDASDLEMECVTSLRKGLGEIPEMKLAASKNGDLFTDERLIRFIRNNELDVERAQKAFEFMIKRRKHLNADVIQSDVKRAWRDDFWDMNCIPKKDTFRGFYLLDPCNGISEAGDLISFEKTGQIQIRKFMQALTEEELQAFWCYLMEWNMIKLSQLSRQKNRIARMIQIKDLDGISLFQASCKKGINRFGRLNKMLHDLYPETLSKLVVINAPPIFGILWSMLGNLIPERTRRKMEILSSNSTTYLRSDLMRGTSTEGDTLNSFANVFGSCFAGCL